MTLTLAAALLAGCTSRDVPAPAPNPSTTSTTPVTQSTLATTITSTAIDAFFQRLSALCGKSFAGKLAVFNETDIESFSGPAVMHVRECSKEQIKIPFHVGENRSRTWLITRVGDGLRLKHDHRHEDGSSDALTMYGGDTAAGVSGSQMRQEFPADAESKAMFEAGGLAVSVDNVWAVEVDPGRQFAYELKRPNRHFRVEFDLTRDVPAPPPPWGSQ